MRSLIRVEIDADDLWKLIGAQYDSYRGFATKTGIDIHRIRQRGYTTPRTFEKLQKHVKGLVGNRVVVNKES